MTRTHLAIGLSVLLAACAAPMEIVGVRAAPGVLYLFTPPDRQGHALCAALGDDTARFIARANARLGDGQRFVLNRVIGCHVPIFPAWQIIVCPQGDPACLAHEERHMREGAWHP